MTCDHCRGTHPQPATRTFDVPGARLVRLCETHAAFWVASGRRPGGTVEIVHVELSSSDVGVVPELTEAHGVGPGGTALIVARSTYLRWAAAQAAWEDAQTEMTTELAKASVGAMALGSDLRRT